MLRRLRKEFKELLEEGPAEGFTVSALSPVLWEHMANAGIELHGVRKLEVGGLRTSLHCLVHGQPTSPLHGGQWEVRVDYPDDYPFKPPCCDLLTPFWHPDLEVPAGVLSLEEYNESSLRSRLNQARAIAAQQPDTVVTVEQNMECDNSCVQCFGLSGEVLATLLLEPNMCILDIRRSLAEQLARDWTKVKLANRRGSFLPDDMDANGINTYCHCEVHEDSMKGSCPQTLSLNFKSSTGEVREQSALYSDTVATLKASLAIQIGLQFSTDFPEALTLMAGPPGSLRKLQDTETVSSIGLTDGDVVVFLTPLYAAPCGPFSTVRGDCESCKSKFDDSWSPALTTKYMLEMVRHWMHEHRQMHHDMKRYAGRIDRDLPGWSPWVVQERKVKNLLAAVLLAEHKLEEYEAYIEKFKHLFSPSVAEA